MKEKMTIKDFFEAKDNLVIHCDTEEKAEKLLREFGREGYRWCTGNRYIEDTNWEVYRKRTCYSNSRGYGNIEYFKQNGYTVVEFDEIAIKDSSSEHKDMNYDKIIQLEELLYDLQLNKVLAEVKKNINRVQRGKWQNYRHLTEMTKIVEVYKSIDVILDYLDNMLLILMEETENERKDNDK